MKTFITDQELDAWLASHDYFEDGYILRVDFQPLKINVGYTVKGNYKAYSEQEIVAFQLIPGKILEWTCLHEDFTPSQKYIIDSIQPLAFQGGIGLKVPGILTFLTDRLTITEPEIIKTTFQPWLSDREIFVSFEMHQIPKPIFWKQKLDALGYPIIFRYYAGPAMNSEELPYPDYTGYFIQIADRIAESSEGIFIQHLSKEEEVISFHFVNMDEKLQNVWSALMSIFSDLPFVKIQSGNCEFSGLEWKKLLEGHLTEQEGLIIDCISDTHGQHEKLQLPGGDILIHAGDCTSNGELDEALEFLDWYKAQNYAYRILVAGNHDFIFELIPELMDEECKKRNIILLNDSGCEIEGIKIWGSPVQPWFCDWAFNRQRGSDIKKHWNLIPKNTEILITHGPPYKVQDEVKSKDEFTAHVGCEDLYEKIVQTKIKLHIFGHVHEGAGYVALDGRIFVNASSLDSMYKHRDPGYIRVVKKEHDYSVLTA